MGLEKTVMGLKLCVGDAHDVGEDGTAGSNQGSDHGRQVVVQHVALGTQHPAGVGVEHGDDLGHVGAADGHGEGDAHDAGQRGGGAEHAETHAHARVHHEVAHRAHVGGQQTRVQGVAAGQHQGVGAQVAGEGDAADVGAEEGGGLDHGGGRVRGEAGVVVNVGGDTGQHGGHAHQRVEGGHQLRQVRDLNLLRDGCVHEDHPYSVIQSFPSFDTAHKAEIKELMSTNGRMHSPANVLTVSNVKTFSPSATIKSLPGPRFTKLVSHNSSAFKSGIPLSKMNPVSGITGTNNKPIRMIKLTPAQAEALKRGRAAAAGHLTLAKDKLLMFPTRPASVGLDTQDGNGVNKENGNMFVTSDLDSTISEEPKQKIVKLDNGNSPLSNKEELQRKLKLQLQEKAEEAERLKEESRKRELECEKLKAQLDALSE